eukprot:scaffold1139_cov202-Prasinococcus_capsulatus_cf.AAC.5
MTVARPPVAMLLFGGPAWRPSGPSAAPPTASALPPAGCLAPRRRRPRAPLLRWAAGSSGGCILDRPRR